MRLKRMICFGRLEEIRAEAEISLRSFVLHRLVHLESQFRITLRQSYTHKVQFSSSDLEALRSLLIFQIASSASWKTSFTKTHTCRAAITIQYFN